jgi:hypothetical protein
MFKRGETWARISAEIIRQGDRLRKYQDQFNLDKASMVSASLSSASSLSSLNSNSKLFDLNVAVVTGELGINELEELPLEMWLLYYYYQRMNEFNAM